MTTVRMDAAELISIHDAVRTLEEDRGRRLQELRDSQRVRLREAAVDVAEMVLRELPKLIAEMPLEGPGFVVILKGSSELERAATRPLLELGADAKIRLQYGELDGVLCVAYMDSSSRTIPGWTTRSWPERV